MQQIARHHIDLLIHRFLLVVQILPALQPHHLYRHIHMLVMTADDTPYLKYVFVLYFQNRSNAYHHILIRVTASHMLHLNFFLPSGLLD